MTHRLIALIPLCFACATGRSAIAPPVESGASAISDATLLQNITTLSSDAFGGRAPGSAGEVLTTEFLIRQFTALGLAPGNPDGTFLQKVPLVGITADPSAELVFTPDAPASTATRLRFADDFVAWTRREEAQISIDAPLVFVGYGVVAPEYQWDDFKDVDVRGKLIVILINDPPIPDPKDPSKLDASMFKGNAMTWYGRWPYKFETAAAKGAIGALIVHETGPAAYGWDVVRNSNAFEHFTLVSTDQGHSRSAVEGWITEPQARSLFQSSGLDFDVLHKAALSRDFKPVPLPVKAKLTLRNTVRHLESHNVVARLEGADPALRSQSVVYTAHWDHLGTNATGIYHGAIDNASGVSGLIEIARAFKAGAAVRRSMVFLAVTAEEKGLLGSQYYAEHPLYPLRDTVAEINMDGLNVHGRTRDVTVVGLGQSQLDDLVREQATVQHRTVHAEPQPEKGMYYRSDHLNFARVGVPALDAGAGIDIIGKPDGWGLKMMDEYTARDYHKPTDIVRPDWDLSGAIEDLRLLFVVGERTANTDTSPQWSADSEFRAIREKMMQSAAP